jgi:predicted transcriptional regulator
MNKPNRSLLTEQELEIMKIVWDRGRTTVREVYEELLGKRRIAYTTVMTMMGILEKKGHLKRSTKERAHVYQPVRPKAKVVGDMVQDFVSRVFDGSAKPLLVHLVEEKAIDEGELAEIEKLLRHRREKRQ